MNFYEYPREFFNDEELDLLNNHYLDDLDQIPPNIEKRLRSKCLFYENSIKTKGFETVMMKVNRQKKNRNRSQSVSSTSSCESTTKPEIEISTRLVDESLTYADAVARNKGF